MGLKKIILSLLLCFFSLNSYGNKIEDFSLDKMKQAELNSLVYIIYAYDKNSSKSKKQEKSFQSIKSYYKSVKFYRVDLNKEDFKELNDILEPTDILIYKKDKLMLKSSGDLGEKKLSKLIYDYLIL